MQKQKQKIPNRKYHFMIGTTSQVPNSNLHYLILDIDKQKHFNLYKPKKPIFGQAIFQKTQNGWHVYTPYKFTLKQMLKRAKELGADKTWCRLALRRGWAFLADKEPIKLSWPVRRMVIGWLPKNKHQHG